MSRFTPVYALLALLLLLIALPAAAHNGAVAIAVPVEGIAVDGDVSSRRDLPPMGENVEGTVP